MKRKELYKNPLEEEFEKLIKQLNTKEDVVKLTTMLGVSKSTVKNWIKVKTAPHPLIIPDIILLIKVYLENKEKG